ncbi:chaperone SurA [Desulfofustis limnaeus]|jgi:peptidyl-prolyl cis-trans isomerase SurA|uniref:Chaperone SurA n=2 Tax=Desulfofustis limnaeus TaxID=2740163 RepID=A0ABM7WAN0_9BACT|nr:chaperone SurA [Desulfofustis limnaeus]
MAQTRHPKNQTERIMTSFSSRTTAPLLAFAALLLTAAVSLISPSTADSEVIDRVIAEVNDDIITTSELDREGQPIFQRVMRESPVEEQATILDQVRRQVLDSLIDRKLIMQEAVKQGIEVSEAEIDATVKEMLAANNLTKEAFVQQLEKNGLDEATYRRNLRVQLLQNKLLMRDVNSKILITDAMVRDFYQNNYTQAVDPDSYYLLQIGISWDQSADANDPAALEKAKQEARRQAERVRDLAINGQDFRDLARRFSDLPSAEEGGDLGSFAHNEMADYMKKAVTGLQPGQISDIVETPFGYQFFQLLAGGEAATVSQAPFDAVQEEIRERLFREAMQKQHRAWMQRLRDTAYIRKS